MGYVGQSLAGACLRSTSYGNAGPLSLEELRRAKEVSEYFRFSNFDFGLVGWIDGWLFVT
jgi:hypothetical protein